jgi:hypothetical protein
MVKTNKVLFHRFQAGNPEATLFIKRQQVKNNIARYKEDAVNYSFYGQFRNTWSPE